MFDTIVMVDWSAAGRPKTGRDSVWICRHGAAPFNPATRAEAASCLRETIAAALAAERRMLVGFDFPFGYPAGFAAALGLAGAPWRAVWDAIAGLLHDDPTNANNRFAVAAEFNRRVSGGCFPFWGCPKSGAGRHLAATHHRGHRPGELRERRLVDALMVGAQPCWKLLGTGSVGGQALTGIPVVRALRDDPRWREVARVWPFETGLRPPREARVVFAEVWPSLWDWKPARQSGEVNDAAQVRHAASFLAERAAAGELDALFAGAATLTAAERLLVESEEAWTLGVTAPRATRTRPSPAARGPKAHNVATGNASRHPRPSLFDAAVSSLSRNAREGERTAGYDYLRNPAAITRRSLALVRAAADLDRFPPALRPLAMRLAHAAGDVAILADLAWSQGAVAAGRRALLAGAPILVDAAMVAAGINRVRLPAGNAILCTLPEIAVAPPGTTRSAAAVALWRPHLAGAVVAVGNAPTALYRLLELLAEGASQPALVLGFPVGFVGAAEAKAALAAFGHGLAYVTLHGRRGGSALAAAAVNALAGGR